MRKIVTLILSSWPIYIFISTYRQKRLLSQVRRVKVTLSCLVVFYSFSCYVVFHSLNTEGEQSQLNFTMCYILHTRLLFYETCNKRNDLYAITIIYFILVLDGDVFELTHVFMGSLVLSYYKLYEILECRIGIWNFIQLPLKYIIFSWREVKEGIVEEASYDFKHGHKKQTKLNK